MEIKLDKISAAKMVETCDALLASEPPVAGSANGSARAVVCPQCGDPVIQTNLGNGKTDDYCENCGWPDENRSDE